jgi:hypothetical protein
MRLVLLAGIAGIMVVFAAGGRPAAVWETLQQIYPSDPAQRQALDQCFLEDHRFDRLDRTAREACYRRNAATGATAAPDPTIRIPANSNFVDLWRAAGQGRLPRHDLRFEEQMARYYHPVEAGRTR